MNSKDRAQIDQYQRMERTEVGHINSRKDLTDIQKQQKIDQIQARYRQLIEAVENRSK